MTARAWLIGAGIAIAFPVLVHLLLYAASHWSDSGDPGDFAYHDTFFTAYHIGWAGDVSLGLGALVLYVLTRSLYRKTRSRNRR